jgi:hypothetical protein
MTRTIQWPSREEWAKRRRTAYVDERFDVGDTVTKRWSAYVTPPETAAIIAALKRSYREHGRRMSEAKKACQSFSDFQWQHYFINRALKIIAQDRLPATYSDGGNLPELAKIKRRWEVAQKAAVDAYCEEVTRRPIDDEAWAEELKERKKIEGSPIHIRTTLGRDRR